MFFNANVKPKNKIDKDMYIFIFTKKWMNVTNNEVNINPKNIFKKKSLSLFWRNALPNPDNDKITTEENKIKKIVSITIILIILLHNWFFGSLYGYYIVSI